MGFLDKFLGNSGNSSNSGNSVSAGRDIKNNYIYQDNRTLVGGNGPTCPFDWQIGYGTCGCCPKAEGCEKWHALKARGLKDFSD
jgi:hypothetical protein